MSKRVQRRHVVRQRRARASKPKRQARALTRPALDLASLEHKVYLTIPELTFYGPFQTENATRLFLSRFKNRVPTLHPKGLAACVARRDFDRYVQSGERHAS